MDEAKQKKARRHLVLLTLGVVLALAALSLLSIFTSGR